MYAASTTSTSASAAGAPAMTGGGGSSGGGGGAADRRVRVVRLVRPRRSAPAFGFALRGGYEHSTGFFISKVEFNSEAQHQGLKVGDQVVSVNGYRVEDAVHTELAHYLAAQSRLNIKVRNVGMIPVKEKSHEALSWQFVAEHSSMSSGASSSPTLCDTERMAELRLSLVVPPRAKLGCGICKGPDWKPGIFVQFVREGGIAREAGLRPGDQIISCNGHNFANISFNEAISVMKSSSRLDMCVREGAGLELVSPESSGYNSSASSAAGERSPPAPPPALAPPAALRRRLASVAEEAADRADRLNMNRLKRRTWGSMDFDWKNTDIHNFDAPSDIEPDYDSPSIPNNPHSYENQMNLRKKEFVSSPSNKTIINLTEDGATIQCNYDNHNIKKINNIKGDNEKTVVVEVHHMNGNRSSGCSKPTPPQQMPPEPANVANTNSLSNAIAEEIQRRKLNKKNCAPSPNPKPAAPQPPDTNKRRQHDALIDEFKKVHRKMFADRDNASIDEEDCNGLDRQPTLPLRKADDEHDAAAGVACNQESASAAAAAVVSPAPKRPTEQPPPPPPMPKMNGHSGDVKKIMNHIQEKLNTDLLNGTIPRNGTITPIVRTPTPDYNSTADVQQIKTKILSKDEKAELESIDSYKMKNPSLMDPKPPSNYFMKAPNGTATMKKHVRPVSVTIGEYGACASSRKPAKLEFLNGDVTDGPQAPTNMPLSNRLQSELALTLSRSNLRKKTETLNAETNKELNNDKSRVIDDASLDKNFHKRYGNNILPMPPSISIPKVSGVRHSVLLNKMPNNDDAIDIFHPDCVDTAR